MKGHSPFYRLCENTAHLCEILLQSDDCATIDSENIEGK